MNGRIEFSKPVPQSLWTQATNLKVSEAGPYSILSPIYLGLLTVVSQIYHFSTLAHYLSHQVNEFISFSRSQLPTKPLNKLLIVFFEDNIVRKISTKPLGSDINILLKYFGNKVKIA